LPYSGRLERIDWRVVVPKNGDQKPKVLEVSLIHPDEVEAADVMATDLVSRQWPRLEIFKPNLLGAVLHHRGYVVPLSTNNPQTNLDVKYDEVRVRNGQVVNTQDETADWGERVNLNRFFLIPDTARSWAEVIANVKHTEVRLILEAVRAQAELEVAVITHEDLEFDETPEKKAAGRQGAYVYDVVFEAQDDWDHALVLQLMENWRKAMVAADLTVFTGIDDPTDRFLNNHIQDGYAYSPDQLIREASLEAALVKLEHLGLTKIKRAFVLEVPGGYPLAKKQLVVKLFNDLVIGPYLAAKNIC